MPAYRIKLGTLSREKRAFELPIRKDSKWKRCIRSQSEMLRFGELRERVGKILTQSVIGANYNTYRTYRQNKGLFLFGTGSISTNRS